MFVQAAAPSSPILDRAAEREATDTAAAVSKRGEGTRAEGVSFAESR